MSFLSNWPQKKNTRNEFHFGVFHVNSYKRLTRQQQPPEVFYNKRCSWKFRKIHRKTPVPEALAQVFSCEFCEISKNTFFTEHLQTTASDETTTWKKFILPKMKSHVNMKFKFCNNTTIFECVVERVE